MTTTNNAESLHADADRTVSHHPECDGLRFHTWNMIRERIEGVDIWRAECYSCDFATGLARGEDTVKYMFTRNHPEHDGLCHGECSEW